MKSYSMDHEMAVAAWSITAPGVALETSNKLTAYLYVVFNYDECLEVADRIAQATLKQADYESRIEAIEKSISAGQ